MTEQEPVINPDDPRGFLAEAINQDLAARRIRAQLDTDGDLTDKARRKLIEALRIHLLVAGRLREAYEAERAAPAIERVAAFVDHWRRNFHGDMISAIVGGDELLLTDLLLVLAEARRSMTR